MNIDKFYELFSLELKNNRYLYPYYKLLEGKESQQEFRKAYYLERLRYIDKYINKSKEVAVLDCGCGYGSTALYLAMNGVAVRGTTLEFYYEQIEKRKTYWKEFGNIDLFQCVYENIFDNPPAPETYDYIILQDTLHHIEPIEEALKIFYNALKKGGKLILVEENGGSIVKSLILWMKRRNNRVIEYYDPVLDKNILMGNENIRSEKKWTSIFLKAGFSIDNTATQYIRMYPPFAFSTKNAEKIVKKEQNIWAKKRLIRENLFFGLNMIFTKE